MRTIIITLTVALFAACSRDAIMDNTPDMTETALCQASEPSDVGAGIVPQIAATKDTFGAAFLQGWGKERGFTTIDPVGRYSTATVVLPSQPDDFPQLVGLENGFLAHIQGSAGWTMRSSFFSFDSKGLWQGALENVGNIGWLVAAPQGPGVAKLVWTPAEALSPPAMQCDERTDVRRGVFKNGKLVDEGAFYCPLLDVPVNNAMEPFTPFLTGLAATKL